MYARSHKLGLPRLIRTLYFILIANSAIHNKKGFARHDHNVLPTLVLFSGLPGTGKSSLSYELARLTKWALLSKDQVDSCCEVEGVIKGRLGYEVLFGLAKLNLSNQVPVILDATFAFERLRHRASQIATANRANYIPVECTCSDDNVWRQRVGSRQEMVTGWKPADWGEVERVKGYYEKWSRPHLTLDAINPLDLNCRLLLDHIETLDELLFRQSR